ncbi:hypothetical protein PVAG01_08995 [Phlyctema vagabunda]|uniref:ABM domain-containing protein n=1 Tax=Phlyctema vagabunda TaxID=108571 RepID=A0ABR4P629_9HELO
MARIKATNRPWQLRIQSWTRCRIPIDQPIPHDLRRSGNEEHCQNEWQQRLSSLVTAPGYGNSQCRRDIDNPENVLFVTVWKDDVSIQSFKQSPGYPAYLQAFFGVPTPPSPSAFFTTNPGRMFTFRRKVTILTLSYTYPIAPEDRPRLCHRGLGLNIFPYPHGSQYGLSTDRVTVREPQMSKDGQMVENVMLIQEWPQHYNYDMHATVIKDPVGRKSWEYKIKDLSALFVEEVTWISDIADGEDSDGVGDEQEHGTDDENDDEMNQILASKQLLEG